MSDENKSLIVFLLKLKECWLILFLATYVYVFYVLGTSSLWEEKKEYFSSKNSTTLCYSRADKFSKLACLCQWNVSQCSNPAHNLSVWALMDPSLHICWCHPLTVTVSCLYHIDILHRCGMQAQKQNAEYRSRLAKIHSDSAVIDAKGISSPFYVAGSSTFIASGPPSERVSFLSFILS